jgi:hypothetical protein
MNSRPTERRGERGSALLIVFLFAAVLAITLYREMPVYSFEARRQSEQLLIDRGNEYKHAVKLYYRKVGGYPASITQLENTNRLRFLRHRFKDPFTDKDDWRLLHMGPGNRLLDSKVDPITNKGKSGTGAGGSGNPSSSGGNSTSGSPPGFGPSGNTSTSFGGNTGGFTGLSNSGSDNGTAVKVPDLRQRGPAVTAAIGAGTDDSSSPVADSLADQLPAIPRIPESPAPLQTAPSQGNNGALSSSAPGQGNMQQPGSNTMQMVQGLFNNQAQSPRSQNGTAAGFGVMQGGGGMAGVASRAAGHSIKDVNDQDDYSLWEFYYDPTKDLQPGLPGNGQRGAAQPAAAQVAGPNATTPAGSGSQSNSGFHLGTGLSSSAPASNQPQ